jgi:hypothetical protein
MIGTEAVREAAPGDATASGARTTRKGKASHRGHGGRRGGMIGTEAVRERVRGDADVLLPKLLTPEF